ncbi:acetyltransferase [Actibacterium pelagium]|uniref:Hexapeptide transferase n=1 Tax=Actibacterium pelagium TaxID=2029103 RepID=A0A917ABE6_9RHOB|nr:acetyltransferase [Actibacterium pelagium]GGE39596.1 hexapeptide transferase [Actibacterium pelagium]
MTRCVILGSGGHGRAVAGLAQLIQGLDVVGVLDEFAGSKGEKVSGIPVVGIYADLPILLREGIDSVLIAVGNNTRRASLFQMAQDLGADLPSLCHPSAVVEPSATIGKGSYIGAMSYVGVEANVRNGVLVNTRVSIDHECQIDDFVSIAPASTIAGRSRIEVNACVGMGCSIADRVNVGASTIVGAGAVVLSDIPANAFAVGIPAKVKARAKFEP